MIGSVTFDGAAEAPIWTGSRPTWRSFFEDLGLKPQHALELAFLIGLIVTIVLVYGFYRLGMLGAQERRRRLQRGRLARAFVHSLVPIALAYVAAHYFTLLLFQGQAVGFLASDPLGDGSDLFGTAGNADRLHADRRERPPGTGRSASSSSATWPALMLAHDRALAIYDDAQLAVRSQYWMLAVMVGFTSLALWLLSQAT